MFKHVFSCISNLYDGSSIESVHSGYSLDAEFDSTFHMLFHVFSIYVMVVPLKVCRVGTHWM